MGLLTRVLAACIVAGAVSQPATLDVLIQRHGESINNVPPCTIGSLGVTDTQLTGKGKQQALGARDFVRADPSRQPDVSFSSCLMRAMQTAALTFERGVFVADYIPEWGFDASPHCHTGGSCALTPLDQMRHFIFGRDVQQCPNGAPTPIVALRADWRYVRNSSSWNPWMPSDYTELHAANWNSFLDWVWKTQAVKDLVARVRDGKRGLMSITSHGGTMGGILPAGWKSPANAAIYRGKLELDFDENGQIVGFKKAKPSSVTCEYNCPTGCCGTDEQMSELSTQLLV